MNRLDEFKSSYMAWSLLILTVFVYLVETFSGGSQNTQTLIYLGAEANVLIRDGQWWRLIAPIFLHIGIFHILMNGFTLFYVGRILEPVVGHWRFLVIYMVSGIIGNLASFAFGADNAISAGASTSLFGMFGVFLSLALIYRENRFLYELGKSFLGLIVINLIMDLTISGINIWGHLGGALGGILLGYACGLPNSNRPKMIYRILVIVITIVVSYLMYAKGMMFIG
ncbi:rhomboid family intramembrane serine protease [Companilactobacillus sp. FL22-1]|uniref:rhomboid family intramembrane serine protease n=1 Tax=Companilactobacillus sp. FL22-1 TaxID=3373892 RepID=UPI0037547D58